MATSSQNNLIVNITRQDANGVTVENRTVGAISFAGVSGELDIRQAPDTSQHTLDVPTPIVLQFYFRNLSPTANFTIVGTPQGGASVTLAVLPPGAAYIVWNPVTSGAAGYTTLKYTSDTSGAPFEMFLGG